MIRPPAPPTRMESLMDFQDTVQRGDSLEAMEMQRLAMQPMSMPMNRMPMKNGGLVTLPVTNRFIGGLVKSVVGSVAPSLVGRAIIGAGGGLLGGGIGAAFTGFLADKILGKKTNIQKNILQGLVPVGGSYLRGGATNILRSDNFTFSGPGISTPTPGMMDFGGTTQPSFVGALGDQFTRSNLEEIATEAAISDALGAATSTPRIQEQEEETGKKKSDYKGVGLQKRVLANRRLDDPQEFDPDAPEIDQAEAFRRATGEAIRTRQRPRFTYVKTTKGGGLAGLKFEGRVPGRSDGMEDDQYYAIREAGGPVEGLLAVSPKEYVVPADVMSILGNGNPDAGADAMDQFSKSVRMEAYGTPKQQKELDGLRTINRNLRG